MFPVVNFTVASERYVKRQRHFYLLSITISENQKEHNILYSGPLAVIIGVKCFVQSTLRHVKVDSIPFPLDVKSEWFDGFLYFTLRFTKGRMMKRITESILPERVACLVRVEAVCEVPSRADLDPAGKCGVRNNV